MRIAVIGTGYVGLVTGTCFAEAGNDVVCVDIDKEKVAAMKKGKVPIYEPGLEAVFHRNIAEKRLDFTTNLAQAVKEAEVIFLALPTPPNGDGSADLSYILKVADQLGGLIDHYCVIVNKSTVPVGTAEKVTRQVKQKAKSEFDVVSNPEFLREGHAVEDFQHPDRIVVGTSSTKARKVMDKLYKSFVEAGSPIYFMDERSAEITKYAANSFLAMKISFMNQIANLCDAVGANVDNVRLGVGSDNRIGSQFLYPGIGYGGSCFPKDVLALQHTATEHGADASILQAVTTVNSNQQTKLYEMAKAHYDGKLKGKKLAIWGLAFKPDTDDIREAPALKTVERLLADGATVAAFDPEATTNTKRHFGPRPGLAFAKDRYDALKGADALLLATEWPEFQTIDLGAAKKLMRSPVIFDGRNVYDPSEMKKQGFHYESIGRPMKNA